jgi:hypothetical protein
MVIFSQQQGPKAKGKALPYEKLLALLDRARSVLERHMFEPDGEAIRDDVAEVCMAIDDALPEEGRIELKRAGLERSAA